MRVETLERIVEKSSRGPWKWNPELSILRGFDGDNVLSGTYRGDVSINGANAAFIYTSRIFLPMLIDVLKISKAYIEQGTAERRADLARSIRQLEDL